MIGAKYLKFNLTIAIFEINRFDEKMANLNN